MVPRNHKLRWGSRSPYGKGQFWKKEAPIVKYRDFLPLAVQKWLNWSTCHFRCGLGRDEVRTSSIVFARWRQCALMGATWWIWLNRPSDAWCGLMSNYFDHLFTNTTVCGCAENKSQCFNTVLLINFLYHYQHHQLHIQGRGARYCKHA